MGKYLGKYYSTKGYKKEVNGKLLKGTLYKSKYSNDYSLGLDNGMMFKAYYSKSKKELIITSSKQCTSKKNALDSARRYIIRKSVSKSNEKTIL